MSLISEDTQYNKLKKLHINIKTKYITGNKILERNTDNSNNDDIKDGIRCKKEYYLNDKLVHTENKFDSRITYTFISKEMENKDYKCPNCGMSGKLHDFLDGCQYCKTYYNIDYTNKDLGSKYHYDRVLRNTKYRIITGIIDIIISLFLTYLYIINTSRTFNSYDISKIFIYGFILSLILYYFFYIMDAYIILRPIKRYKDKQNQKQIDFWKNTKINKKNFFNNYNYEVRNKYYSKSNIIDYDVIDFDDFKSYKKNNDLYIDIDAYVRIVYFDNGKISSKYLEEKYIFKKISNDVLDLKDGANMTKCHNCGASIDVKKGECEFCHTKIKYLQEWIIVE